MAALDGRPPERPARQAGPAARSLPPPARRWPEPPARHASSSARCERSPRRDVRRTPSEPRARSPRSPPARRQHGRQRPTRRAPNERWAWQTARKPWTWRAQPVRQESWGLPWSNQLREHSHVPDGHRHDGMEFLKVRRLDNRQCGGSSIPGEPYNERQDGQGRSMQHSFQPSGPLQPWGSCGKAASSRNDFEGARRAQGETKEGRRERGQQSCTKVSEHRCGDKQQYCCSPGSSATHNSPMCSGSLPTENVRSLQSSRTSSDTCDAHPPSEAAVQFAPRADHLREKSGICMTRGGFIRTGDEIDAYFSLWCRARHRLNCLIHNIAQHSIAKHGSRRNRYQRSADPKIRHVRSLARKHRGVKVPIHGNGTSSSTTTPRRKLLAIHWARNSSASESRSMQFSKARQTRTDGPELDLAILSSTETPSHDATGIWAMNKDASRHQSEDDRERLRDIRRAEIESNRCTPSLICNQGSSGEQVCHIEPQEQTIEVEQFYDEEEQQEKVWMIEREPGTMEHSRQMSASDDAKQWGEVEEQEEKAQPSEWKRRKRIELSKQMRGGEVLKAWVDADEHEGTGQMVEREQSQTSEDLARGGEEGRRPKSGRWLATLPAAGTTCEHVPRLDDVARVRQSCEAQEHETCLEDLSESAFETKVLVATLLEPKDKQQKALRRKGDSRAAEQRKQRLLFKPATPKVKLEQSWGGGTDSSSEDEPLLQKRARKEQLTSASKLLAQAEGQPSKGVQRRSPATALDSSATVSRTPTPTEEMERTGITSKRGSGRVSKTGDWSAVVMRLGTEQHVTSSRKRCRSTLAARRDDNAQSSAETKSYESDKPVAWDDGLEGECSRSMGFSLIESYRKHRKDRTNFRGGGLITSSIICPSFSGGGEQNTASGGGGGTASSRGSRREHRAFTSTMGAYGNVGDALLFNELKWRKKKLIFGKSPIHAWGLYAAEVIEPEEFVVEYLGEYVRSTLADARQRNYEGYCDDYIFRVDADLFVDATKKGGLARFANHCCDGNCYSRIITAGGMKRIVLYSKERIEVGEEITYDYKFERESDPSKRITCSCGSPKCSGFLN